MPTKKYFTEEEKREAHRRNYAKWKAKNLDRIKEYQKKYDKEWFRKKYKEDKGCFLEANKKWREQNREYYLQFRKKHPEYIKRYYEKNLKQVSAHRKVYCALKSGRLVKQPCEMCGNIETEAHHCDYNKPLEVTWLCKKCHTEWHKNNTPIYE